MRDASGNGGGTAMRLAALLSGHDSREVDARTVKRIVAAFNEYFISDDLIN